MAVQLGSTAKWLAHLQTIFLFPQHYPSCGRFVHFWDTLSISQSYPVINIFYTFKGKL